MVALRKESVDRNASRESIVVFAVVALRKESVDRNTGRGRFRAGAGWSLSARRAWIEMSKGFVTSARLGVALRKESVDRNGYRLL